MTQQFAVTVDDLSDDEEDVLRSLRRMAQIETCYRVPPHLRAASQHLSRRGLVREVPWQGPYPPACGTALELMPIGAELAEQLADEEEGALAFLVMRRPSSVHRKSRECLRGDERRHDAPPT